MASRPRRASYFGVDILTFEPLYMTRVWGGRTLEKEFGRHLPDAQPYGESWDLSDRPDEQSIVSSGPHAGATLHALWTDHREKLFGPGLTGERFPLLFKILDARADLSIQVHPPADRAPALGGEPKTEMWYIAAADPGAKLYLGLATGVTRSQFEAGIANGTVDQLVHAVEPRPGQSVVIPSGRLHAIGAGLLIYEIQQNSDTTYRVFDWNRLGLDGKPRALHLAESLQCIDFSDHTPSMDEPSGSLLAANPHFVVERLKLKPGAVFANPDPDRFSIVTVVSGLVRSADDRSFRAGDSLLLPRGASQLHVEASAVILQTTLPNP